jgi:putative ABC transport system substrate-binding protein
MAVAASVSGSSTLGWWPRTDAAMYLATSRECERIGRRRLLGALAAAIAGLPLAAFAQKPGRIYRIGILESVPAAQNAANLDALRAGLRSFGYVEGRNLVIDYRSADGHAERFPALAIELLRAKPDLIVTRGTPATQAATRATTSVPVVMAAMGNVGGTVADFAHPRASVTGLTTFSTELTAKRIELLKELVPGLVRVALLHNMGNPAAPPEWQETQAAAHALGLQATLLDVRGEAELGRAFGDAVHAHVDAMLVGADGLTQMHRQTIVDLAARHRLPAAYASRDFVEAGGLVAYAVNYPDLYFRFARYIDRIFKGARPDDLPIEQPTKFELVVNAGTAKALGLAVPESMRIRAADVIP